MNPAEPDSRLRELEQWLREDLSLPMTKMAPASSDASFRCYFRVWCGATSYIVMDAPPGKEDIRPFIQIGTLLEEIGLHVPGVLEQDLQRGFLLLTDLGSRQYLDELNEASAPRLYGDALRSLVKMQSCPREMLRQVATYERKLLLEEMALFREWYLERHLGISLSADQAEMLVSSFSYLVEAALEQPRVLVHRDYHSRNLMIAEPNPGILDFQDAVVGPVSYDLVSLLRDCYVAWPRQEVEQWVEWYYNMASQVGLLQQADMGQLLRWFDLMGVQRHLKAVGIFSRLDIRDGKPGYLKDIPRTLGHIEAVLPHYPELRGLQSVLSELPASR